MVEQVKSVLANSPSARDIVDQAVELLRQAAAARAAAHARLEATVRRLTAEEPSPAMTRDIERAKRTLAALSRQIAADQVRLVDEDEVAGAVECFDGVWSAMTQAERAEFMHVTLASVEYDGQTQNVSVTFNPEVAPEEQEA